MMHCFTSEYEDDATVVITAKHIDQINKLFGIAFEQINQWM